MICMVKTKILILRITDEQDKKLERLASEIFVNKSEYVRLKLFKKGGA